MQVLRYLLFTLFALSTSFVLANPEPNPVAAPEPQASIPTQAITDLGQLIEGAKSLLSQNSINNIETTLTGAAILLGGSTANTTKNLLDEIPALLTPDLIGAIVGLLNVKTVNQLKDIVDNAHALLTPNFVNETQTLINDVTPLVASLSKVLAGLLSALLG